MPQIPTDEAQVRVLVTASPSGKATRARISQSSKFPEVDAAALVIADNATYTPAMRHCKAIASTSLWTVTYTSNWSTRNTTPLPFPLPLVLVSSNARDAGAQASPSALPALPCDTNASVVRQAQPELPGEVRGKLHEAQISIGVDIAANGKLYRARLEQSSGFAALDAAVLKAALHSTYSPARRNCKNVTGRFVFRVTYSSND